MGTCDNQPRVNPPRGFVFVIGMHVEHILGTGANTMYIVPTVRNSHTAILDSCVGGQVRGGHSGPH